MHSLRTVFPVRMVRSTPHKRLYSQRFRSVSPPDWDRPRPWEMPRPWEIPPPWSKRPWGPYRRYPYPYPWEHPWDYPWDDHPYYPQPYMALVDASKQCHV